MKNKTIFFGAILCLFLGCKDKDPNDLVQIEDQKDSSQIIKPKDISQNIDSKDLVQIEGKYQVVENYTVSSGGGESSEYTYPLQILEAKKQDDKNILIGKQLLQFVKKNGGNLEFTHKEPYTNYGGYAIYFSKQDSLYIEYRGGGQHSVTIYTLRCKKN